MGVAAGALLSALAVDITDIAIMGAVGAAMGSVALSNPGGPKGSSGSSSSNGTGVGEQGEEGGEGAAPRRGTSEPGLFVAAGILAAVDGAKKVLSDSSATSPSSSSKDN